MARSPDAAGAAGGVFHVGPAPRIAVEYAGTGPLVLCLHGLGGSRAHWRHQLQALSSSFTAAAWDARGYGDSDDPTDPWTFPDYGTDVLRVMDAFGADRAHLVGLSMGARIALDVAGRYPARVASLVLADTSVTAREGPGADHIEAFLAHRRGLFVPGRSARAVAEDLVHEVAGPSITGPQRAQLLQATEALRVETYLATLEIVARYGGYPPLATIVAPCLVMVGSDDRIATPAMAHAMAAALPRSTVVEIPGAGHVSNVEQPEAFTRAVRAFLEQHA